MKEKNTEYMPDQYWHRNISFIKSAVRIAGYLALPFSLVIGVIILVFSELIGIIEEMV